MIPRIQTGTSFKGAALYYLHDKKRGDEQERLTAGRLAWTHAINTLENEPEAVFAEMRQTSFDQTLLKQLSGNRLDGRPTERPVMTVALAWSPEQSPNRQDMIDAGMSFLRHMRWQEHQVLFVAHNDTKHPHVHLIINRVHPVTGMTIDDNWSKTRSQRWALAYEREQGHIFCEAREAKYGRDQDTHAPQMNYREWLTWQHINKDKLLDPEHQKALEAGEWSSLHHAQQQERTAFWEQTGKMRQNLRKALREDVRGEFAEDWQAYALVKAERTEKAQAYDKEARRAMRHYRRHGALHGVNSVAQIKERQKAYHATLRQELWEHRADISSRQNERLEELAEKALAQLSKDRADLYKDVLARHREERATLRDDQAEGTRRQDLLEGYGPKDARAVPLSAEQAAAYAEQARTATARQVEFDQTRKEATDAERSRSQETGRDPLAAKPAKETTDRALEQQGKERAREANQKADTDFYLKKRAADRARDRGGGRER
jgi:hypothetical protein